MKHTWVIDSFVQSSLILTLGMATQLALDKRPLIIEAELGCKPDPKSQSLYFHNEVHGLEFWPTGQDSKEFILVFYHLLSPLC